MAFLGRYCLEMPALVSVYETLARYERDGILPSQPVEQLLRDVAEPPASRAAEEPIHSLNEIVD
jgi:hypothetical protein